MERMMEKGKTFSPSGVRDGRVREYIAPCRIVASDNADGADKLIGGGLHQMTLSPRAGCVLRRGGYVIVDFGKEFSGGIKVLVSRVEGAKCADLAIRFGESVTEAMTPVGELGATNDHATRDFILPVSALSANEAGDSGLRFARIEACGADAVEISAVFGVFIHSDAKLRGSFECSDKKLTEIWNTAAYTVYLCMQDYIYDGIKRDRLVWAGDVYPEIRAILAAFGAVEIIPRTLKFLADTTPDGSWMNGMPSYSIWWLLSVLDYVISSGDADFLDSVKPKLHETISRLTTEVGEGGSEEIESGRFIDWQTSGNDAAIHAGLQALLKLSMKVGALLCEFTEDSELAAECRECEKALSAHVPTPAGSKQAAALMAAAGIISPNDANDATIAIGGPAGYSTFMSYFILKAKAEADDMKGALIDARTYYGTMLGLGATTFWEDFDICWALDASRIDEIFTDGKTDVHAACGAHCYKGLRHSLCHGWSAGVCAFLSEYVLGVKQVSPNEYTVSPNLGPLKWARGKYPTSCGEIEIEATAAKNGKTVVKVKAPHGIKIKK